jgi:hypothetical protein
MAKEETTTPRISITSQKREGSGKRREEQIGVERVTMGREWRLHLLLPGRCSEHVPSLEVLHVVPRDGSCCCDHGAHVDRCGRTNAIAPYRNATQS